MWGKLLVVTSMLGSAFVSANYLSYHHSGTTIGSLSCETLDKLGLVVKYENDCYIGVCGQSPPFGTTFFSRDGKFT